MREKRRRTNILETLFLDTFQSSPDGWLLVDISVSDVQVTGRPDVCCGAGHVLGRAQEPRLSLEGIGLVSQVMVVGGSVQLAVVSVLLIKQCPTYLNIHS